MKATVSELSIPAIEYTVASIEGECRKRIDRRTSEPVTEVPRYCSSWLLAGPIIEREKLDVPRGNLAEAMRSFVHSRLGPMVELPDNLPL